MILIKLINQECKICSNYFNNGFNSDSKICNDCVWGIKSFGNFAIIHLDGVGYRFFLFNMTKEDVIEFIKDFEPFGEFEGIDINKTSASKECMLCHYWYFKGLEFNFKSNIFNKCSGRCIFSLLNRKGVYFRCIFWGVSKNEAVKIQKSC